MILKTILYISFYFSLTSTLLAVDYRYNLTLEKTVGFGDGKQGSVNATQKSLTVAEGDILTYKLFYTNSLSSTATPLGTKIYDDYDETKLKIVWLPNNPKICTDDGNKITCDAYNLSPKKGKNQHTFYYTVRVKVGASGKVLGRAEIKPLRDKDIDNSDDISSAALNITTEPVNGACGGGATTYTSNFTNYPNGTFFCAKGTAIPTTPSFPNINKSVSWICKGSNKGINNHCLAKRVPAN